MEKVPVHWAQVVDMCRKLALQARDKDFKSILAISRGGLVPARLLSTFLGDLPVWAITCRRYDCLQAGPLKISGTSIFEHLNPPVLVVDEICDEGETLQVVSKLLHNSKIPFSVAVLLQRTRSKSCVKVDFVAEEVRTQYWYCFPWEKEFFDLNG